MEQVLAIGGAILSSELGLSDYSGAGGELGIDDISIIEPTRTTISNHVRRTAAHRIILNGDRMLKSKAVFIATDHGGGVLVKMAFFYDAIENRVIKLNLDFDKSGHNAVDGGIAIAHSMKKYTFSEENVIKFRGGSSDSGGGFTNKAMKKALIEQDLVDTAFYIHMPCTEHNDQTNLRVGIENVYGESSLTHRNAGQLLHAYSYIQKHMECPDELRALLKSEWEHVRGTPCPAEFLFLMQEPILTRWKTVGIAAYYLQQYIDVVISVCKSIRKSSKYKSTSKLVLAISNFISLTEEPEIMIDLEFWADFNSSFFEDHFEFNRFIDKHIGASGFISHHHLVRYFLKIRDLETIEEELANGSVNTG